MSDNRLYGPDEIGRDGYPLEWHETIKHQVREEAGHRCVRCGHPFRVGHGQGMWSDCDEGCDHDGPVRYWTEPGEGVETKGRAPAHAFAVEAKWRVLTVHHLDGDKANCRWWNLAALCQRCHLTIQGKVQMARVWPWEHSAWFRPYVAGYYAWVYLREEVTREEAEARVEELLALERQGSLSGAEVLG